MRRRDADLLLVIAVAVICAVACAALPGGADGVRILPAALLVLVLPGYALTALLLAPSMLWRAERVVLTIALSMAASVITALVLNAVWHLETTAWAIGLALATALAGVAGIVRGRGRPLSWHPVPAISAGAVLALVGAVALVCGAFALGVTPLRAPDDTAGTTALWISPRGDDAATIGVRSGELGPRHYALDVHVAGRPTRRIGPFVVAPGAERRIIVAAAPSAIGQPVVEAVLRQVDAPNEQLRRVALRAGRRSLQPAVVRRPRCPRSHPLRSANGCYRLVRHGRKRLRYYSSGRRVAVRRSSSS
jgi:Protein of unknown function (DUF1616)